MKFATTFPRLAHSPTRRFSRFLSPVCAIGAIGGSFNPTVNGRGCYDSQSTAPRVPPAQFEIRPEFQLVMPSAFCKTAAEMQAQDHPLFRDEPHAVQSQFGI